MYHKLKNRIYGTVDDITLGLANLHEYLDITKLIGRLQDMDKLKAIFLSEDQKILFECIPKPTIAKKSKNNPRKSKQYYQKMISTKSVKITETDHITKKIIEMLDLKTRNDIMQSLKFF